MRLAAILAFVAGCRCGGTRAVEDDRPVILPHYGEWDKLVKMSALGQIEAVNVLARDLTEGEAAGWAGEGGEVGVQAVGGALGFLQIASSGEDLVDGLPTAAAGCGTCHAGAHVQQMDDLRPAWGHESAAAWAVWGLVFVRSEDPTLTGGDEARAAAEAYNGSPEDPVGALLAVCIDCHGQD